MALDISNWSVTPNSNSSIDGIAISENCPYANMNDAHRANMAAIRSEFMNMPATISAATITNITGLSQFQQMSGNTTIDGFSTAVTGMLRDIRVLGTPLIKNSSGLALQGSVDRQLAAGDMVHARSLGAGNWVAEIAPKDGKAIDVIDNDYTNIASATITDFGAATSRSLNITGAVTIDSFATITAGRIKSLKFASTPLLRYNASSMILPGGANITAAAGDTAVARSLGSGNWLISEYTRASGLPVVTTASVSFSANKNATNQTGIASSTDTKVTFTNEVFDVGGYYDAANSKFLPLVAGKYMITAAAQWVALGFGDAKPAYLAVAKNGTIVQQGPIVNTRTSQDFGIAVSAIVDLNGSTDFVEIFCWQNNGDARALDGANVKTYFQGHKT